MIERKQTTYLHVDYLTRVVQLHVDNAFAASLMEENHCVQRRDGKEARGVKCKGGRRTSWSSMLRSWWHLVVVKRKLVGCEVER